MDNKQAVKVDIIPHVRYDENGNIIERYDVEVPRYTDENNIYLTEDWFRDRACHGHKGDVSKANYSGIGKTVWFRAEGAEDIQIVSMEMEHCGNVFDVVLNHASGGYSELIIPIKK